MTVSGADRAQVGQVAANIRALASARSVQAKGHSHHRRAPEEEGRQGRRSQDGRLSKRVTRWKEGETSWQQDQFENYRVTRIASGFTSACAQRVVGHARASAALRVPLDRAHLRAGDRRPRPGARLFRPVRSTRKRARTLKGGGNIAAAKVIGKNDCRARPRRRESRKWCSIAAATSITAACKLWPKRPGRRG